VNAGARSPACKGDISSAFDGKVILSAATPCLQTETISDAINNTKNVARVTFWVADISKFSRGLSI